MHMYQIKNIKTGKVVVQRSVPSNACPNEISFICQLNTMISRSNAITFRWVAVQNNQSQIKISNGSDTYAFWLNKNLSFLPGSGLTERDYRKGNHMPDGYMIMPPVGNIHMFVYCDVVEHVIVGDFAAPLLHIVQISMGDPRSAIMHTEVNTPLFVPVQKEILRYHRNWYYDRCRRTVPFHDNSGKSHIVLEFKKSVALDGFIYKMSMCDTFVSLRS